MAGGDARPTGFFLIPGTWNLNQAAAPAFIGYIPYYEVIPGGRRGSADLVDPDHAYAHGRVRPGVL
jgi:hypothetical protein